MTDIALVVTRAVHIGAAMLLLGELVFGFALASVRIHSRGDAVPEAVVRQHIGWAIVAGAASWAVWLAIVAARMAGTSVSQAGEVDTMMLVLRESEFGHWWCLRIAMLAIIAIVWSSSARRRSSDASRGTHTPLVIALAAIYVATLAFAGHATAATEGASRITHLACDAMHALAAGAWLGALPALVVLLRGDHSNAVLARATHVFSELGMVSVAILLATGIVNAWFLVGSPARLWDTSYGQLLALKLGVFAAMLSIAAVNRFLLTPRLSNDDVIAVRLMRRNAMLEILSGVLILLIVGALGTMVPAVHQSPASMHHMN